MLVDVCDIAEGLHEGRRSGKGEGGSPSHALRNAHGDKKMGDAEK